MIPFSDSSLLLRIHNWILHVDFVSCNFTELVYFFQQILVESSGFSTYRIETALRDAQRANSVCPGVFTPAGASGRAQPRIRAQNRPPSVAVTVQSPPAGLGQAGREAMLSLFLSRDIPVLLPSDIDAPGSQDFGCGVSCPSPPAALGLQLAGRDCSVSMIT